ncbi:hypothetical protein [Aureibacter tunicatorum]|uniref:N-acetyltransferase domain-containing protein n=1 Tax=Aureibacter tunicatorum TaxID=866807 RepID=A0AAE4BT38_9BACT|nr:hypothetical protein [Aureibacter tunicatorum]MDR6239560.1 hypothetical protein [Aureibacter tunicatorum]BDD04037.1 hypothetical protein AUTU_15200 [Aureibacter tunicatorum]
MLDINLKLKKDLVENFSLKFRKANVEDIPTLIEIQKRYYNPDPDNDKERLSGFVSVVYQAQEWESLILNGDVFVLEDENGICAYTGALSPDHHASVPIFSHFKELLDGRKYREKMIDEYDYCFWVQTCVIDKYRGKGVVQYIYQKTKEAINHKYEIGLSGIDIENIRSLNTHIGKIGFVAFDLYADDYLNKKLYLVAYPLRK